MYLLSYGDEGERRREDRNPTRYGRKDISSTSILLFFFSPFFFFFFFFSFFFLKAEGVDKIVCCIRLLTLSLPKVHVPTCALLIGRTHYKPHFDVERAPIKFIL